MENQETNPLYKKEPTNELEATGDLHIVISLVARRVTERNAYAGQVQREVLNYVADSGEGLETILQLVKAQLEMLVLIAKSRSKN